MDDGQPGDLDGEFRRIKSEIRALSILMSWERWKGLKNLAGTGNIAFTFVNATQFTVNDDFLNVNRNVAVIGRRVKASITGSTLYGSISAASFSSPNTTITVVWDSGSLDATLSEVQFGSEPNALVAAIGEAAMQVFTGGGTYTKPADLKFALVICVGAGGGGGGADPLTVDAAGGGGGGGGTSMSVLLAASIGATETITVGAGGSGGVAGANGAAGGDSSFGSLVVANGGGGGAGPGTSVDSVGAGAAGGQESVSTGQFKTTGEFGSDGRLGFSAGFGTQGGYGGSSVFGGGARGPTNLGTTNGQAHGIAGPKYGGAGSGGVAHGTGLATGGAGGDGIVVVIEFKQ
jgi:hypothetical protein